MHYGRNHTLLTNARSLRKEMTKEERHLWYDFLRYCRPRFRRQEIISNYAILGRVVLPPSVFDILDDLPPGANGEIQLTDALDAVLLEEEMYALVIDPADGFDTGTIDTWLETNNILYRRYLEPED